MTGSSRQGGRAAGLTNVKAWMLKESIYSSFPEKIFLKANGIYRLPRHFHCAGLQHVMLDLDRLDAVYMKKGAVCVL